MEPSAGQNIEKDSRDLKCQRDEDAAKVRNPQSRKRKSDTFDRTDASNGHLLPPQRTEGNKEERGHEAQKKEADPSTRKRKAQTYERNEAAIDPHIPLPKITREQKAGTDDLDLILITTDDQNTRIRDLQTHVGGAISVHEGRVEAAASSTEKTSASSSSGGVDKDVSHSSSKRKRCNAGHLTRIRASQKGDEQQVQARNSIENPHGSSIGAKNIANSFDSLNGRSSRLQRKTNMLQKCDYCKQKHKAEDLGADVLLATACPSFARLHPSDLYCCDRTVHLRSLYKTWLPR